MPQLRRGRSAARNAAEAESLECPLCLELPVGEVHKCYNGHLFCGDCLATHRASNYAGASKCPTCRVALGGVPIRSREAEQRISRLPGACDGCGAGMLRNDLVAHMATCGDAVLDCPFPGCSVRVKRRALAAHMAEANDEHVALAQALQGRLVTAERALSSLECTAELTLLSPADFAASHWEGEPYLEASIRLAVMEPIERQDIFLELFEGTGLRREACTFDVDVSRSPFDLRVERGPIVIHLTTPSIPAELMARRAAAMRQEAAFLAALGMHHEDDDDDDVTHLKVVKRPADRTETVQDGQEILFKCRLNTEMEKIMRAFCNQFGLAQASVRFEYGGQPIMPNDSPGTLGMEDYDLVEAIVV